MNKNFIFNEVHLNLFFLLLHVVFGVIANLNSFQFFLSIPLPLSIANS